MDTVGLQSEKKIWKLYNCGANQVHLVSCGLDSRNSVLSQ